MKVSKRSQRSVHTSGILHGYQRFLQVLEARGAGGEDAALALEQAGDGEGLRGSMLMVSVTGMARLLRKNLHFNFSKNIMQSMVRRVDSPIAAVPPGRARGPPRSLQGERAQRRGQRRGAFFAADMVKKKTRTCAPRC